MIEIRVVSWSGGPPDPPLAARFDDAVGAIGRGADCALVLPDPDRQISRKQALITCRAGQHYICAMGANLSVELNGNRLAPEVEAALEPGSEIRIGPYLLRVDAVTPQSTAPQEMEAQSTPAAVAVEPHAPARQATTPAEPLAMLAALFGGLGVTPSKGISESQMRLIGGLLRATLDGTLQLLAARTIAKRELGAAGTTLQTRENNPLKFSDSVDAALGHLLGGPELGFIAPLDAVRDAFGDLRAHQLAMLAGMRAALDDVLARFDPQVLAERLAPKAMWDMLLPAARKAKLWEQYSESYAEILSEIEDDFDSLFGRAFLLAYKEQLEQLRQARQPQQLGPSE